MKVLAIRGKNLASLENEFEIDFTVEPLNSAGIFAITGNTGSGKSTLLDALCLALFDTSPRTSRASENVPVRDVGEKTINHSDCRTILRRGAIDGYAETEFISLGGEHFRARWSVRRAHNKIEGSLQNSEIRLYNLTSGIEEQGRKTELLNRISELTGLSFEQFTRSVLLAQGDFASFLKAKDAEKAEILEKLTGTAIYSLISISIHEKTKDAETQWSIVNERMKGFELLPEEQLITFQTEKETVGQEIAMLKKDCEALNAQLKWVNDKERLSNELKRAEDDYTSANKAVEDAGKRFEYMGQIEATQEIRDTYGLLKNSQKQLTGYKNELLSSEKEREENNKRLSDAQKTLAESEKEQEQLLEKQKEIAPQIIKARELDIQIKAAKATMEDAQKEFSALEKSAEKINSNLSGFKQMLKQTKEAILSINQWLTSNKTYESIVPRTELLINLATEARNESAKWEQTTQTLAANRSKLKENQHQFELLKQEAERLNQLLPAEIAVLRAQLIEGEPCPVCGSTHHPASKIADMQRMKENELKKAKEYNTRQSELLTVEIEKRKSEIARLTALAENYSIRHNDACRNLENNLSGLPEWKTLFERAELAGYLKKRTDEWGKNTEELNKMQETQNLLAVQIKNEENKLKEASESLTAKAERLTVLQKALKQLQTDRLSVLQGKPADAAEKYFIDRQKLITDQLKKATDYHNIFTNRQASLNSVISRIKENIRQSEERRVALQYDVDTWTSKKEDFSFERLVELLEKDITWIQAEKQALKTLTEACTTVKATLVERLKNLEHHNSSTVKPENESKKWICDLLTGKNEATESRSKHMTEIEVVLSSNEKAIKQMKGLEKELKEKETSAENWKKLNSLLGSADGSKFKKIAQGYTLETLLVFANIHLQELAPRYELQRVPDKLALQVIDVDMLNEVRSVHSLSGGETFLISLALALGLSSLSSNRMKVESLFIDEGFGSLDSDTLRVAMDALEHLRTQGRKIGVISHVAEMTERIAVRIKVQKTTNDKSSIEILS